MTEPIAPVLEPAAQAFADANATLPFLYQLSPEEGREFVDAVQSDPPPVLLDADVSDLTVPGGPLDPLRRTYAAQAAITQGIGFLRGVLGTD